MDRTLISMGSESTPAFNAQQFYVSASRGRESAKIFTDLSPAALREAIQRSEYRKTASELVGVAPAAAPEKPTFRSRAVALMNRVRDTYRQLRQHTVEALTIRPLEREPDYAR